METKATFYANRKCDYDRVRGNALRYNEKKDSENQKREQYNEGAITREMRLKG